jgi:hypothetical protein
MAEFNWRTLENPYVIAPIEVPLKRAAWRSKFVIFLLAQLFFEISLLRSVDLVVLVHFHHV